MNFKPGEYDTFDDEWYRYKRKDGKLGAYHWRSGPWYTPLFTCDLCGKTSTPKNVCHRNDCYLYDLWARTPMLCTGCWNKVKPVVIAWTETKELRKIVNKLRRAKYVGKTNN